MQKIKSKTLTIALLVTMALALFPLVNASTGTILIETATAPSTVGIQVAAGGVVNLYFGGVTWSGGQFYLLMSTDGFSQVSTDDMAFTPTFNLANLTDSVISTYTMGDDYSWDVGDNWVNGTIKKDVAGGNYFIKAFDGTATSVAVTDTYLTVIGALEVEPTEGPGGASINLTGYAFAPNDYANLSYYDPIGAAWVTILDLLPTDDIGQFTHAMDAPDLMQVLPSGDNPEDSDLVTFRAIENVTGDPYTADYTEWQRGLMQIDDQVASVGLYGNATSFVGVVMVGVFQEVIIAGNWFHPGNASILWDGSTSVATTAVNGTGFFNTTFTVPITSIGNHDVVIQDATTTFLITIEVTPTLVLTPDEGPVTTLVKADGYGFPGAVSGTAYNVTLTWYGYEDFDIAWALVDSSGKFTTTFEVPHDYGGEHDVEAVSNDTALTTAIATFEITPTLVIVPASFDSDCILEVTAQGTGFNPDNYGYTPNIDNNLLGIDPLGYEYPTSIYPNATGDLSIDFIGCGFRPGWHVFSLYEGPSTSESFLEVAAWACFYVTTEDDPIADTLVEMNAVLLDIEDGVAVLQVGQTEITADISDLNAKLVSIEGDIATIATDLGTVQVDVAAIKPVVTAIEDDVATVQTDVGTIKGTVTSVSGDVATIKTDVGTIKANVSDIPTEISGVTTPIWIAVILSLIAAIAAIIGVIQIRQKIAG